eukprot:TRINITY_DN6389_c0_g1_i1.p1 TRINITY_DN6389_c0_g1~~TRINITY_DN6389_c0_g1_i1.p1  ORF type:complete len:308 (+),score=64.82 TRINITY_DN6389_c0_g1_i1:125-1048(+)
MSDCLGIKEPFVAPYKAKPRSERGPKDAINRGLAAPVVTTPFASMKISSADVLYRTQDRSQCSQCGSTTKYYCVTCPRFLGPRDDFPLLNLPIKLDIIHHPTEKISKSTAVHASLLAPDHVRMLEFPDEVPEYSEEDTLLLYPKEGAPLLEELEDLHKYKRLVAIDSQWNRCFTMCSHPNFAKLKCVRIKSRTTLFWRWQVKSPEYLATIEAIYYFYADYERALNNGNYDGKYDDILYLFAFHYTLIQSEYRKKGQELFRIKGFVNDKCEVPEQLATKDEVVKAAAEEEDEEEITLDLDMFDDVDGE